MSIITKMIDEKRIAPNASKITLQELWYIWDYLEGDLSYCRKPWFLERVNTALGKLNPQGTKTEILMEEIRVKNNKGLQGFQRARTQADSLRH